MRILNIESATNFSGGVNQTIINCLGLRDRGHEVYLACVYNSPIHKRLKNEGIGFVFIDEDRVLYSAGVIRGFLKNNRIDIVHTHHSKGHEIGLWALMFRKKEKLVVQRSVLFPTRNLFKYLNPRIDLFIANSNAVKDVLVKHFVNPSKVRVVYSAANADRIRRIDREEIRERFEFKGFVFGVVGNYSHFKGHDLLLEAFFSLGDNSSMLVLIGKDTEKLKTKAEALDISDRVKILGFRPDAVEIMNGFDALVVPSFKESFPNVVIEAFLLGIPVVGSAVGGVVELLSQNRGVLAQPNPSSLRDALKRVMNIDRKPMIDRAYRFALDNLLKEKKIERLETVYKELLE
ncbi:glycosyltransferase [Hippea maritima]|uniref:Glycosyl transferase group 1 n=1 Tax=Hippea maritima (strain ATCC 700847 / DSM 10411 / MH2) TaxID=760142 RepID=F2LU15_HIPMA|nr:glycosyltransferase [Hippea maritima]AEA33414.1 glycosyl transferase group 1 [Hippea maritima DSM 10411]